MIQQASDSLPAINEGRRSLGFIKGGNLWNIKGMSTAARHDNADPRKKNQVRTEAEEIVLTRGRILGKHTSASQNLRQQN